MTNLFPRNGIPGRGKEAFTLTEVIIAVFIVLVLVILAFASFGRISEKSKSTGCINNLRQVHIAFMGYAADNANKLPLAMSGYGITNSAWMNDLKDYIPEYIRPRHASISVKHPFRDPGSLVVTQEVTAGSYGVNRDLLGQSSSFTLDPPPLNILTVSEPSKRLLLMCAGVFSINYNQASNGGGNTYLPGLPRNKTVVWAEMYSADATQGRHGRRVNAVFLGGNVESVPPEDLISRSEVWQRQ